jgi:hypothetical protein
MNMALTKRMESVDTHFVTLGTYIQFSTHSEAIQLQLDSGSSQLLCSLAPAKFGNNCLRLPLDLAAHNSTSTATPGIWRAIKVARPSLPFKFAAGSVCYHFFFYPK